MKEQDLHIGCSYLATAGAIEKIITPTGRATLSAAFDYFSTGHLKGISLDEDALVRLGMTKDENKELYTIRLNADYTLELTCNGFSNHEDGEYYISILGYYQQITFTKRYVHELQILYFSLTSEFLPYKQ